MKLPRPRFSLRTLVIFLLLVTAGVGLWWHWEAWYEAAKSTSGSALEGEHYWSVRVSPDSKRAAASRGNTFPGESEVILWNIDTARCLATWKGLGYTWGEFSPDGRWLVVHCGGGAKVVDPVTGDIVARLNPEADEANAQWDAKGRDSWKTYYTFDKAIGSPDGAKLLTLTYQLGLSDNVTTYPAGRKVRETWEAGTRPTLRSWDASTWRCTGKKRVGGRGVNAQFSPDGSKIALTCGATGWYSPSKGRGVKILDAVHLRQLAYLEHKGSYIRSVAWLTEDRLATPGHDGTVIVWSAADGEHIREVQAHDEQGVINVLAMAGGTRLLSYGYDDLVKLWDPDTGECLASVLAVSGCPVGSDLWPPRMGDAAFLVPTAPGKARLHDAGTGRMIVELAGFPPETPLLRDLPGTRFFTRHPGGGMCRVWDAESGRQMGSFESYQDRVSADGRRLLVSHNGHLRLLDARSLKCLFEFVEPFDSFQWESLDGGERLFLSAVLERDGISIWRRRRPEWWWGVFWLWEFWLTVAFAGLFVWSVVRDRRVFRLRSQPAK